MKKKYLVGFGSTLGAALLIYFFAFAKNPGTTEASAGGPFGGPGGMNRPPAVVSMSPVEQGDMVISAEFVGVLQATAFADLYAKAAGQVLEVFAETGAFVRSGQVLARIDDAEAIERVHQARAALRMAEATRTQREATLSVARMNAERTTSLFQKSLTSQQEHDASQAELLSALAQLELAEAQIEQARANLGGAEVQLQNTRVIAPFNGYIAKRHLDRGAFASTNRPVFTMVDMSTIKTTVSLVQRDASRISVGQAAMVRTDAVLDGHFEGRVARISPVFNPETNTAEAEIEINNADGRLKPGMFATVSVAFQTEPEAILVPRQAVVTEGQQTFLFVAEEKDDSGWSVRRVPVRLLGAQNDKAAIDAPVKAGQMVVTLGQETLRDGAPIVPAGVRP